MHACMNQKHAHTDRKTDLGKKYRNVTNAYACTHRLTEIGQKDGHSIGKTEGRKM